MLTGLYSSATGLNASERIHEVVSENLAHVGVPGYRANRVSFHTFEGAAGTASSPEGYGVLEEQLATDFSPGAVAHTGRSLDVAISGEGFFVTQGPEGPMYTRNGVFFVGEEGRLVNSTGMAIEGQGGPITIPPEITPDEINFGKDGSVNARGSEFGKLRVVEFDNKQDLVRAGTTLFTAPAGVTPRDKEPFVLQGSRELSNVSAVEELVRMIVGTRHYEAAQRALTALDEAIGNNTNPQA